MGGGGGGNPLSGFGNMINQGTKAIGNFYGFDSSGHWTNSGGVFHALDEGLGEVTGRNQSRAAMNQQQDQYNQARTDANNLIAQQRWNTQQSDMMASSAAAAGDKNQIGINYGNATPMAFGPGYGAVAAKKDFLGL